VHSCGIAGIPEAARAPALADVADVADEDPGDPAARLGRGWVSRSTPLAGREVSSGPAVGPWLVLAGTAGRIFLAM